MCRHNLSGGGRWPRFLLRGLAWPLLLAVVALLNVAPAAWAWKASDFANRVLVAYPVPQRPDNIIGQLETYRIKKGDTLLDVGRYYDLSGKEVSEANNHLDWWSPPVGKEILLPTEHILPDSKHVGIVMNIPEMRVYYYPRVRGRLAQPMVYTFPVGLGRMDWRTPIAAFYVRGKTRNPPWIVPEDIYEEHLERDGYAEHMIPGGDPDNPEGLFRLDLSLPEYALHGTNDPWGVGMEVSHGCVRLYPEDIEALFKMVPVGTPGVFVYQPIKFGWRGGRLYVEVHDDLYARYPGMWNLATHLVDRLGLTDKVDMAALEKAVEAKSGVPTYVGRSDEADAAP
jgi:L,D-transpeptidase ErfK/SrfK